MYHYVKFAGVAVAGISDTDWTPYIEDLLGFDFTDQYAELENTMPWVYKCVNPGTSRMRLKYFVNIVGGQLHLFPHTIPDWLPRTPLVYLNACLR